MKENQALPVRDVLRLVVPSVLAAAEIYGLALLHYGSTKELDPSSVTAAAFSFSLLLFLLKPHNNKTALSKWLWKNWHRGINDTNKAQYAFSGRNLDINATWAKPIYSVWIEAFSDPGMKYHIRYNSGIFYMSVSIALTAACAGLANAGFIGYHYLTPQHSQFNYLTGTALLFANILLTVAAIRRANQSAEDVLNDGLLLMATPENQEHIQNLYDAADRLNEKDLENRIARATKTLLTSWSPLADIHLCNIEPEQRQADDGSGSLPDPNS